jgi:hypothetical protein
MYETYILKTKIVLYNLANKDTVMVEIFAKAKKQCFSTPNIKYFKALSICSVIKFVFYQMTLES